VITHHRKRLLSGPEYVIMLHAAFTSKTCSYRNDGKRL
jgi:hypothetical protein